MKFASSFLVDDGDADGGARTGLNASGRFPYSETVRAHVALADDAEARGILRHFVRTFEDAILASDALVIEMANDPGDWIFFVGENRAAVQAGGINAVMASSGDSLLVGKNRIGADELAD